MVALEPCGRADCFGLIRVHRFGSMGMQPPLVNKYLAIRQILIALLSLIRRSSRTIQKQIDTVLKLTKVSNKTSKEKKWGAHLFQPIASFSIISFVYLLVYIPARRHGSSFTELKSRLLPSGYQFCAFSSIRPGVWVGLRIECKSTTIFY